MISTPAHNITTTRCSLFKTELSKGSVWATEWGGFDHFPQQCSTFSETVMTPAYFNMFSFYSWLRFSSRSVADFQVIFRPKKNKNKLFILWEVGFNLSVLKGVLIIISLLYHFICCFFSVWQVELVLIYITSVALCDLCVNILCVDLQFIELIMLCYILQDQKFLSIFFLFKGKPKIK